MSAGPLCSTGSALPSALPCPVLPAPDSHYAIHVKASQTTAWVTKASRVLERNEVPFTDCETSPHTLAMLRTRTRFGKLSSDSSPASFQNLQHDPRQTHASLHVYALQTSTTSLSQVHLPANHPSYPSPSPSSLPSFPIPTCRAKHLLATIPHCHHTPVNTITSQRYSTAIKPTTLATTSLAYHYLQRPRTPLSTHCPPHTSYFYRQGPLP